MTLFYERCCKAIHSAFLRSDVTPEMMLCSCLTRLRRKLEAFVIVDDFGRGIPEFPDNHSAFRVQSLCLLIVTQPSFFCNGYMANLSHQVPDELNCEIKLHS